MLRWKFTTLLYGVMDHYDLSAAEFAVLDLIKHLSGPTYATNGWCNKSVAELAYALRQSDPTVNRSLKRLKELKLLEHDPSLPQLRRPCAEFVRMCDTDPDQKPTPPAEGKKSGKKGGEKKGVYQNDRGSITGEGGYQNDRPPIILTEEGYQDDRAEGYQNDRRTYIREDNESIFLKNENLKEKSDEDSFIDTVAEINQRLSGYQFYPHPGFPYHLQNWVQLVYSLNDKWVIPQSVFMAFLKEKHPAALMGYERNYPRLVDTIIADLFKKYHATEFKDFDHLNRTIHILLAKIEPVVSTSPAVRAQKAGVDEVSEQVREASARRFVRQPVATPPQ